MGIHITWDNPERTLLKYSFGDDWSPADYRYAYDLSRLFKNSVSWTVDFLIDLTQSKVDPEQVLAVFGRYENDIPLMNQGIIVIVGADLHVRSMLAFRRRISYPQTNTLYFALTIEDAHKVIDEYYAGLVPA